MYPYPARMSSRTGQFVDSTGGQIQPVETLDYVDSDYEGSQGKDSEINKNLEICELERLGLDNEDGIEKWIC
jgi:hypothetical protein